MSNVVHVKKVAVLGAGVMGAQIAAHLVNAGVETILFDLPAKEGPANGVVLKAIANLGKLSPAPLSLKGAEARIIPANYDSDLSKLETCDLIIEAIAERMDWKQDLYKKIAPHVTPHAILASNTSGLGINALADVLPEEMRSRFCGVHFFNPPRYMHLAELIPASSTDPAILNALEAFLVTTMGKGVVIAKDTPNFIGNRIGVFAMLAAMKHTQDFGLGFDTVDGLTGPSIGRPKSATFRTADVVGLDTLAHVIKTMADTLPNDPWHEHFVAPAWISALIEKGALGSKTGAGLYTKRGKDILVLDLAKQDYRASDSAIDPDVAAILKERDPAKKFTALRESGNPQAQFLWAVFRDTFHYSAYHLADIAATARDVDLALRWGYGWSLGPFETWQAAGWKQVAQWIADDIVAGKAMANAPLPNWVFDGRAGVHTAQGSFNPTTGNDDARSSNAVYSRQRFPDPILGEVFAPGTTIWENEGVRLWRDGEEDVGVLSFKTKMHTVNDHVLNGIREAIKVAEGSLRGLVIWQPKEPFSAGADLAGALDTLKNGRFDQFEALVENFQRTSQAIKYSAIPVIAAVRGLALGGGCEFQMHSARSVFALESYVGLVEAGVGLLPAGGGLKEFAARASEKAGSNGDVLAELKTAFESVAMAKVSTSAHEARQLHLARESDLVILNPYELLHVAKAQALALAESGYRPPVPPSIRVAGDVGIATFRMMLVNMKEGYFISDHDNDIATRIATVICGGDVDRNAVVDEEWLLTLERKHFVELAKTQKTQDRIAHMLATGKPLRN